jgi:peptide/nickel transport system ATP-binding protein
MALMGLLPDKRPQVTGSIRFDGQELVGQPDDAAVPLRGNRIGMVFQEPMTALNPVHTIGRQVAEPLRLHRAVGAAARAEAIALLDRVGIPEAAQRSTPTRTSSRAASASASPSPWRWPAGPTC